MSSVSVPRFARLACAALLLLGFIACGQESRDEGALQAPTGVADSPQPTPTATAVEPTPTATAAVAATAVAEAPPPTQEFETDELPEADLMPETVAEQRAAMLRRMRALQGLEDSEVAALEAIMAKSKHLAQGNPEIVRHPMTRAECVAKRRAAGVRDEKKARCDAPYMVPLYDPETETEADARVCIDRYEFPGLPCEYPVTWVTTAQAQSMCKAIGKRLCDAHEWEGGCAGSLLPPEKEYAFQFDRDNMRGRHNASREIRWAYGEEKDHGKCGTSSSKSKTCESSGWKKCGSNSYPAGSFPECRSPFGVYDQHGNVAEHMSLPLKPKDLGSRGGFGVPEMKGSWFIFSKYEAHIDDCRWRAPSWHDNEGRNHANYHLGFRCCKDVE